MIAVYISSVVLQPKAAENVNNFLAVKQSLELKKPFQTSHTIHTIIAGC